MRKHYSVIDDCEPHAVPTAIDWSRQLTYDDEQIGEMKAIVIDHREMHVSRPFCTFMKSFSLANTMVFAQSQAQRLSGCLARYWQVE